MLENHPLWAYSLLGFAFISILWGIWPYRKGLLLHGLRVVKIPKLSIDVKNPQYYIVEQDKFTVELEVTIKCSHTPIQLASLQLLIAKKAHDFSKTSPPFKDEITTNIVSYRAWYEMEYRDFLMGRVRSPNGGDSTQWDGVSRLNLNDREVLGRILAKIGSEDIYSPEFIIESRLEKKSSTK